MKAEYNTLLARQMRKHLGGIDKIPKDLSPFLDAVNESYGHFEADRMLSDRAMEISSQELYAKNLQLRRQNEMLDAFVYRVSHDLKTPLNNIASLVFMLEDLQTPEMIANPMISKILQDIGETTKRMGSRIADLLDISRIEQAASMPDQNISLPVLLDKVLLDLAFEIEKSGAEVESDFAAFDNVLGNPENINSLLSNLMSNAIKYRSPDRMPFVKITTSIEPPYQVLSVQDNGIGIDLARHRSKLFGMFNRFHSHVPGTGVGLYIIKNIIEKAGGKIEVESTVGEGTTFKVYFNITSLEKETKLHPARG